MVGIEKSEIRQLLSSNADTAYGLTSPDLKRVMSPFSSGPTSPRSSRPTAVPTTVRQGRRLRNLKAEQARDEEFWSGRNQVEDVVPPLPDDGGPPIIAFGITLTKCPPNIEGKRNAVLLFYFSQTDAIRMDGLFSLTMQRILPISEEREGDTVIECWNYECIDTDVLDSVYAADLIAACL